MKIYKISYNNDVGFMTEWFSSKAKAAKRHTVLKRQSRKYDKTEEPGEDGEVSMVHHISEVECEISAKGIIHFLNWQCKGGT